MAGTVQENPGQQVVETFLKFCLFRQWQLQKSTYPSSAYSIDNVVFEEVKQTGLCLKIVWGKGGGGGVGLRK